MITLPELAAEALGSFLASDMKDRFGTSHARLAEVVPFAARMALECIGNSDALYHNVEHTILVTLAGHDIFKGRALLRSTTPADYSNFIIACLTHDIGYVRGIIKGDEEGRHIVDPTCSPLRGALEQGNQFIWRPERFEWPTGISVSTNSAGVALTALRQHHGLADHDRHSAAHARSPASSIAANGWRATGTRASSERAPPRIVPIAAHGERRGADRRSRRTRAPGATASASIASLCASGAE
jgi:hypothetical protein